MIETRRMIANIIGHLRLCYQLLKFKDLTPSAKEAWIMSLPLKSSIVIDG
jgi:hypothetical protein